MSLGDKMHTLRNRKPIPKEARMAGHRKWANIQHRKGCQDAKRGAPRT